KNTARAFPVSPGAKPIGAGIVDANAAVVAAGGGGNPNPNPNPNAQSYSNGTDYAIPAYNATGVTSSIVVSGRTGNAPSNAQVTFNVVHPAQGDLKVDLIAPDGSVYTLHNRTGGYVANLSGTVSVNLSSEALNGTWKLRVADNGFNAYFSPGRIDTWGVTF
ncbi:MAG: proprotein convertase P-domain-containing protein, partial [Lysobacter sp.]